MTDNPNHPLLFLLLPLLRLCLLLSSSIHTYKQQKTYIYSSPPLPPAPTVPTPSPLPPPPYSSSSAGDASNNTEAVTMRQHDNFHYTRSHHHTYPITSSYKPY
eukprot:Tamp_31977.p1 GENE.Tamp_31977~~Tamp_31977.p1  ORF type:complete len:103 (+),score=0.80 Tamp_31977:155-463(+)